MRIVKVSQLLDDRERNYLLYNGDVIIFEKIPAILELNGYLDRLVQDVFGGLSKCSMLNECSSKQDSSVFGVNIERLQNRFRKEPAFADLFRSALKQTGMDIERNYADVLFLRCVAPLLKKNIHRGRIAHHRDTWGSNIQQQVNWWSSLYPTSDENTLVFYPEYWDTPVENSTSEWSYSDFCKARSLAKQKGLSHINYPYAPEVTQSVLSNKSLSIVTSPGDLVCFSSAHLHGSTEAPRGSCRFSIELRTFAERSTDLNIPPKNIDNANGEPRYDWFKRLSDKKKY
ncbi:hypothetical protein [Neptunomonas sp.]|uniref:hypothetical protein n=1 Tax=Neptunomonas sp. TaxID=1971898 RepID=UPI0025F927BC|nr:hypothetical protein [Neptunomonas sp.]